MHRPTDPSRTPWVEDPPRPGPFGLVVAVLLFAACGGPDVPSGKDTFRVPSPSESVTIASAITAGSRATPGARVDTLGGVLSVSDAYRTADGWALLDGRGGSVHIVPDEGEPVTFARRGEGPGELGFPVALVVTGDLLAVGDASGRRVSFFETDGRFRGDVALRHASCPFGSLSDLVEGRDGSVLALRVCTGLDRSMRAVLLEAGLGKEVRKVAELPLQDVSGTMELFRAPAVALWRGGAYLGVLPDTCLRRVWPEDAGRGGPAELCMADTEGPLLPDTLRVTFQATAERLRAAGVRLDVPSRLPAFQGVASAPPRLGIRVALPDASEAMDVLDPDGQVTRIALPEHARVFLAPHGLLLVRDLMEGTELTRSVFP